MESILGFLNRIGLKRFAILSLILFGFAIVLAFAISNHYGQNWDDLGDAAYGRASLRAYGGSSEFLQQGDRIYYGPFHFMLSALAVDAAERIAPSWHPSDVRHMMNFASFLLGVNAFILLARRLIGRKSACLAALLFATQPLLFGHAFINQKDIPFMSFFSLTIALGLLAADALRPEILAPANELTGQKARRGDPSPMHGDWRKMKPMLKVFLILLLILIGFILLDLAFDWILLPSFEKIIEDAYHGEAWVPINQLFAHIAEDAYKTPLPLYLEKLNRIFSWAKMPIAGSCILIVFIIMKHLFPSLNGRLNLISKSKMLLVLASFTLGLTTSIRIAGPFAGLLVSLYFIYTLRRRAILPLLIYWLVAIGVTYLTWPFLWDNPAANFRESLQIMSHFRSIDVLYRGRIYPSSDLPWHYLPTSIALNLTEPSLLLIASGLILTIRKAFIAPIYQRPVLWLIILWAILPLGNIIIFRTPIYHQLRQLLFMLPAMFLIAGIGLSDLLPRIRRMEWRIILGITLLLPGIWGIGYLHPYEYTYFNSFTGGVSGAHGQYELDYWCTAYREAAEYLNQHAEPGDQIFVLGPNHIVRSFLRSDMVVIPDWEDFGNPDYILICNWPPRLDPLIIQSSEGMSISRGEAIYAIVRRVR